MAESVRLHDRADQRLNDLVEALEAEFGRSADRTKVASALIHGVTLAQAAGMLDVYIMYTKAVAAGSPPRYQEPPPLP
jgi:hypothetical protein